MPCSTVTVRRNEFSSANTLAADTSITIAPNKTDFSKRSMSVLPSRRPLWNENALLIASADLLQGKARPCIEQTEHFPHHIKGIVRRPPPVCCIKGIGFGSADDNLSASRLQVIPKRSHS